MELLLWRWSTSVQITSDLIIAVFFVVLARSVGRSELRAWVGAWLANLVALAVTIVFWLLQPRAPLVFAVVCALYVFAKTMFIALLAIGSIAFTARRRTRVPYAGLAIVVAVFAVLGGMFAQVIDQLGMLEATTICLCLAAGAVFVCIEKPPGYAWLATGFVVRAALAAAEAFAYAEHASSGGTSGSPLFATFLASHSSFDTGAEWMIALGCVLTLYRTIQQELIRSNSDLHAAQRELQTMLDHDQLTGALNRRSLPAMLRDAQTTGAAILFFDLDGFKKINDTLGHHAGDACLCRFAQALQERFRAGDRVMRYAGDEFLVIASGTDPMDIDARIAAVRDCMRAVPNEIPRVDFSVGVALLPPGGDAEAALRAADEAMYRNKKESGGAEEDRTPDLCIANAALSQLSYRPTR